MDQHLANLLVALDEMAVIADALQAAEHAADPTDQVGALVLRSDALRDRLGEARAAFQASGGRLPSGPEGARLLARMKSCNERIRSGDLARRRIASFRETVAFFGDAYLSHVIANLPEIAASPSVARLRGAFAGKLAVLVSAGPSLARNIETVRRFKGKALIVAVSHALGALERADIVPDIVVVADPGDLRRHFGGASASRCEALVLATSCDPRLFELPAPRFVTFGANLGIDMWAYDGLEEKVLVPSGGSVATCALSLLHQWGCTTVILAGQDLAFTDGRCYAAGNCDDNERFELTAGGQGRRVREAGKDAPEVATDSDVSVRRVPGYHGGEVLTDAAFFMAREWFIDTARDLAGKVTLLNCTEGGAYLDGMEHVPLEEAAARYLTDAADLSVAEVLGEAARGLDPEARRRLLLGRVKEMRAAGQRCWAQTTECRTLATKARRRPELAPRLKKAEAALGSALSALAPFAWALHHEIRRARASAKDELEAAGRMYEAVGKICERLGPLLQAAEGRLAVNTMAPSAA